MYTSPLLKGHEPFPEIKEENKGKFTAWVKKICQVNLLVRLLVL